MRLAVALWAARWPAGQKSDRNRPPPARKGGPYGESRLSINEKDRADVDRVAASLTEAWNAADGVAFGTVFAEDADFVNIRGGHFTGRETISKAHQEIFGSIYRGSRIVFTLSKTRQLADGLIIAILAAHLQCPNGPLAGEHDAVVTAVLRREPSGWQIVSFHNTLKQAPPPGPPR